MCPGPSCGAGTAVIDARRGSRGVGVPVPAQASAVRGDTALRPGFMGWTVVVETGKGRDGPPASPAPLFPASDRIPQGVSDPPGSVEFSACPRDQGVIENPLVRSNNCRCTVLGQDHPGSGRSQPATKVCDREHRPMLRPRSRSTPCQGTPAPVSSHGDGSAAPGEHQVGAVAARLRVPGRAQVVAARGPGPERGIATGPGPGGDSWGDVRLDGPAPVISRGDQCVITQAR